MASNKNGFPKTIFIVPDGNRRQATRLGLPSWNGHQTGYKTFKAIFDAAWNYNIEHFVFLALSCDNFLKRPAKEIEFLLQLFGGAIEEVKEKIAGDERGIRFYAVGDWREYFSRALCKEITELEKKTAHHKKRHFSLLLAYDGYREALRAFQKMHLEVPHNGVINNNLLLSSLQSGHIPPVDLYIRTGCEDDPHLSGGALMFQMANAQLAFTKTLWPDFTAEEFGAMMHDYAGRTRRLGA